jgi:vacuolar-type H+-ATPase catalytic subunit A/Vma1
LRDLVDFLLTLEQEKRPSIEQVLRQPIIREELDKILNDFIPLTKNYSTAYSAHKILEQIVEIQCVLGVSTDYGLPMIDKSLLKVANTLDTHFLLQAELKAIKQGL